MIKDTTITMVDKINNKIHTIRGQQVMIDSDLAGLYQIPIKRLNEQVKRNKNRFPERFCFQLTVDEYDNVTVHNSGNTNLRSQNATLKTKHGQHRKYLPYVFTEQGVAMLSAVLKSTVAINVSIQIMDAFVQMRKVISDNTEIFSRLEGVETRQLQYKLDSDKNFQKIFKALDNGKVKPKQGIFYNGQIFDAYLLIAKIIKSANKEILLIDNYIDETILELFNKRKKKVKVIIYTQQVTKILQQDLAKYNKQYQDKQIKIKTFKKAHDRFIIIDNKLVYHLGASLKDLGKKWFAFSKLEIDVRSILNKLNK